jgi:hypothetical protein
MSDIDWTGIAVVLCFLGVVAVQALLLAPRPWRVSLRGLLIALTLVAVGMGLAVMMLRGS